MFFIFNPSSDFYQCLFVFQILYQELVIRFQYLYLIFINIICLKRSGKLCQRHLNICVEWLPFLKKITTDLSPFSLFFLPSHRKQERPKVSKDYKGGTGFNTTYPHSSFCVYLYFFLPGITHSNSTQEATWRVQLVKA